MAGPIIITETRKRGPIGWLFAVLFWVWQALIVILFVGAITQANHYYQGLATNAEKSGAAIGNTLGFTFLLIIWALGSIIFGALVLFTRGKKILRTEGAPK